MKMYQIIKGKDFQAYQIFIDIHGNPIGYTPIVLHGENTAEILEQMDAIRRSLLNNPILSEHDFKKTPS